MDKEIERIKNEIKEGVCSYEHVLQMHGFHIDDERMEMSFDMVISFEAKDRNEIQRQVVSRLKEMYPDYEFIISLDIDISD